MYDFCVNVGVKCDPYKNYEEELLKKNGFVVMGGNEFIYYNDVNCINCGKPHYRNGLCIDCCELNFKDRMIGNKLYGESKDTGTGVSSNIGVKSNAAQQDAVKLAAAASSASSGSYRVSGDNCKE